MSGIKSSYEAALEKMKKMDIDEPQSLTAEKKGQIEDIRREYNAKIAEKKILLDGEPELAGEVQFLEREREKKIKQLYED